MQSKLRITPAPSNLTKYAQKTLCTKTPLSRGVTGKTFTDTEKNTKKKKTEIYPFSDWDCHRQPSKNHTTMFSSYCIPLVLKRNKDKRKRLILLWFAPKHAEISTMHAKMTRQKTGFIFYRDVLWIQQRTSIIFMVFFR